MSIKKLTKKATLKFADMCDEVEQAHNRLLASQRRIAEVERQLRNLNRETSPDEVAGYEDEIRRLSDRRDLDQQSYLSLERVLTAVRAWLAQLSPDVELQDVPDRYYLGEDTESSPDSSVERCRADILKLQSARASVARAVPPVADLYEQADRHVDVLAARGRPTLSVERDQLIVKHNVEGYAAEAVVLLAWLHPEAMKARLRQDIDQMRAAELKRHVPVMPRAERVAKLAELDERILAVEREEEFFIVEAEGNNMTIPRRDNENPAAILCVEVKRRKSEARAA